MAKTEETGKNKKTGALVLPEGFDPYNMSEKQKINPEADEMNYIRVPKNGMPFLACGAKRHRTGEPCGVYAGRGTEHVGRGRCKNHAGNSTGPVTEEGKFICSQNSRLHGLYSQVLLPWERPIFDKLVEDKDPGLTMEIIMQKTKILSYLNTWRKKALDYYEYAVKMGATPDQALEFAEDKTEVLASFDEAGKGKTYYHAMTIEDKALDRALRTLANLVKAQIQLNPEQGKGLLDQINEELKAASYGRVSLSWGGNAPNVGRLSNNGAAEKQATTG